MPRFRLSLVVLGVLLAAAGCATRGTLRPNLPPETTLFVTGDLDTVNHVVRLHWFGSDPDGRVARYELRFRNPALPAETAWVSTTRTDSLFTVFTPEGFAQPVFEVRAVDNQGEADPTPARNDFRFSNQPPSVRFTSKPAVGDTTFASVTVAWSAADIDGDASRLQFRLWLDGAEAAAVATSGRAFTMPTAAFLEAGTITTRRRTLFIQPIDDGGRAGALDSATWVVRRAVPGAVARLLLIDDVPTSNTSNTRFDTLYANAVARYGIAPDEFTLLRLQTQQPFRSAEDVRQTFAQFQAVVWYRANETTFSTLLRDFEPGLTAYVNQGGRLFLEGLYLLEGDNATGALSRAFVTDVLDCNGLFRAFLTTSSFSDSTNGFGNTNNSRFRSSVLADSTRQQTLPVRVSEAGGLRAFKVKSNDRVLMWALPGQIQPVQADSLPVAVIADRPGGGRVALTTVPFSTSIPALGSTAPRLLPKVLDLLLGTPSRPRP